MFQYEFCYFGPRPDNVFAYGYDLNGNMLTTTGTQNWPSSPVYNWSVAYAYDRADRMTSETETGGRMRRDSLPVVHGRHPLSPSETSPPNLAFGGSRSALVTFHPGASLSCQSGSLAPRQASR